MFDRETEVERYSCTHARFVCRDLMAALHYPYRSSRLRSDRDERLGEW